MQVLLPEWISKREWASFGQKVLRIDHLLSWFYSFLSQTYYQDSEDWLGRPGHTTEPDAVKKQNLHVNLNLLQILHEFDRADSKFQMFQGNRKLTSGNRPGVAVHMLRG